LVPISVAPSGIVLPITLEFVPDTCVEAVPPLGFDVQMELGVRPPPSKAVEDVDDDVVSPVEPVELQVELGEGPRPPGSISVAPSGTPAPVKPLVPLVPDVPVGEVVPIPSGLVVVCAWPATQGAKNARTAIKKSGLHFPGASPR
jgi:hypothetical protein